MNDLNGFAMDVERLWRIADVLSHVTSTRIFEEQVLALAMQLFIQNYNVNLREMNPTFFLLFLRKSTTIRNLELNE